MFWLEMILPTAHRPLPVMAVKVLLARSRSLAFFAKSFSQAMSIRATGRHPLICWNVCRIVVLPMPPEQPAPKVSVIIPNCNHARFLRQRMRSVLDQTYQDFEVAYLDDASTDDSNQIIGEFLGDPRIRALYNTSNSGTPFAQWNKGVALARGEYVWIAESDDSADPRFLEKLVPVLDQCEAVGLVHCQFWMIDEKGEKKSDSDMWWRELDASRWTHDFVSPGHEELKYLGCWNVISNASGVLFRKNVYVKVGGADEGMRLAGDWLLWMKMLLVSDVAFVAMPLNHWRWHPTTVRARSLHSRMEQEEIARVLRFYAKQTGISPRAVQSTYHVRKGGHALAAGLPAVAIEHACASVRLRPIELSAWGVMIRALLVWGRRVCHPRRLLTSIRSQLAHWPV